MDLKNTKKGENKESGDLAPVLEPLCDDPEAVEAKEERYTNLCCQRKTTFTQSCMIIIGLFFVLGALDGYQNSVHRILESHHVSFKDFSIMSFAKYPKLLKFAIAPFIDAHYFQAFGKAKTYLIGTGVGLLILFLTIMPMMEHLVENDKVKQLTVIFFISNLLSSVFQVSATVWIVTLFPKKDKARGSFFRPIGDELGQVFTLYLFIPLNNIEWVNEHLFLMFHRSGKPLYQHWHVCFGIAAGLTIILLFLSFFVAEKKIKGGQKINLKEVIKHLPTIASSTNMWHLLLFIFLLNGIDAISNDLLSYRLVNFGIKKEELTFVDLVLLPWTLFVAGICQKFIKPGRIMLVAYLMAILQLVAYFLKYLLTVYLSWNGPFPSAVYIILFLKGLLKMAVMTDCYTAYMVVIADVKAASTIISIIMASINLSTLLPKTLGLYLAHLMDFDCFFVATKVINVILLIVLYQLARSFDKLSFKE